MMCRQLLESFDHFSLYSLKIIFLEVSNKTPECRYAYGKAVRLFGLFSVLRVELVAVSDFPGISPGAAAAPVEKRHCEIQDLVSPMPPTRLILCWHSFGWIYI